MSDSPDRHRLETEFRHWLEEDEAIVAVLRGDGASVFATERRVVIVREGSAFRPRSGVRSWAYDRIHRVSLAPPNRGQARLVLRTGAYRWQAVSMFFGSHDWPAAERLIGEISRRLATDRGSR